MHSPCLGQSELFDSADLTDHIIARDSCRSCPMITDCRERSADLPFKEGTWAGELWVHGRRVEAKTSNCRGCGKELAGHRKFCSVDCYQEQRRFEASERREAIEVAA